MHLQEQVTTMLLLQERFNRRVNPNWREAGYAWHRAIWMETAELIDGHTNWKWWKGAPPSDRVQAQYELTDIWHFLLSWGLAQGHEAHVFIGCAESIQVYNEIEDPDPTVSIAEAIAKGAINENFTATCNAFARACGAFELDLDLLYRLYVSKNALNHFRKSNGYADNSYVKIWNGREDNQHLAEIMDGGILRFDDIVAALAERYKIVQP